MTERKKVAIVGSGSAGIGALWALKSTDHEVHLYESASRLGGHTNTLQFKHNGKTTNVDGGFIVLNTATYPNFIAFLKHVGVPMVSTDMTFGISRDRGAFEWAGSSLGAVFAQNENLFNPGMWRMIFDVIRFNQFALDLLKGASESETDPSNGPTSSKVKASIPVEHESIGSYLEREGYSQAFKDNYLIPMTACVWSTSPDKCSLDFPAITLVRFLWNHHLLSTVSARPQWMTIKEGSKLYIDAVMEDHPKERVHLDCGARHVHSTKDGKVKVTFTTGETEIFDHVILATHGDQAMEIIRPSATVLEEAIMSEFKTSPNTTILHSDLSLMPKRREAWSAWNYLTETGQDPPQVSLTYNMNILQHIPTSDFGDVLVTLNPIYPPDPKTIQSEHSYRHPLYNAGAVKSQSLLPRIQNTRGVSYAGAWTKYGFHEDGFSSGIKVAVDHLGAELPFEFVDSTFSRGRRPVLGWKDYLLRIVVLIIQILIGLTSKAVETVHTGLSAVNQEVKKRKVV